MKNIQKINIQELRKQGWKIKIRHKRRCIAVFEANISDKEFATLEGRVTIPLRMCGNGGQTEVELTTPDGRQFSSISRCGLNDPFSRSFGAQLALRRIFKTIASLEETPV